MKAHFPKKDNFYTFSNDIYNIYDTKGTRSNFDMWAIFTKYVLMNFF